MNRDYYDMVAVLREYAKAAGLEFSEEKLEEVRKILDTSVIMPSNYVDVSYLLKMPNAAMHSILIVPQEIADHVATFMSIKPKKDRVRWAEQREVLRKRLRRGRYS